MITRSKRLYSLLLVACTGLVFGCGGGGGGGGGIPAAQVVSGNLVGGPIKGAVVFADRIGGSTRFVLDGDEIHSFVTDGNGHYTLSSVPNYKYVLVSRGGQDTLTGQDSIQMLAQPGSANITILTTLVTLDTTQTLYKKLQALQPKKAPIDFNISKTATPATLLLAKSVETAVQAITKAATSNPAAVISAQQIADIQFQAFQQIALSLAATSEKLAAPAGLNRALQTGVDNAIAEINKAANIKIDPAAAVVIADNSVASASTVLSVAASSETELSVSTVQSEIALAASNPSYATTFSNAISTTSAAIVSFVNTLFSSTPSPYAPPTIVIVVVNTDPGVITGGGGVGGGGGGTGGGF